jgi:FKBP-type peptidyl-prolyl cis-trans isomerase
VSAKTTKTAAPNVRRKLPSGPMLAAIVGGAVGLALTIWIFAPGGFLDSLVAPQETEVASDLILTEQEVEVPDDLSREKNDAFLVENAKKAGVQVTKTGLHFRQLKAGAGKKPGPTSDVTVHYTGTFINGKVFDSSVERGEPATFPLNGVIPGWTEGLQMMREGEKAELVIPHELAYGPGRRGIPPYQTLVFQVELIAVR